MKAKISVLTLVVLLTITNCVSGQMMGGANVSIFAQIPLAPNVVLSVASPVIVSPGPAYIWIDGYWSWDFRMRGYVWVQGFWALTPFPGAIWTPGFWESYRGGYRWINARWWPGNSFAYGFQNNRFDYFGRPVYFSRPQTISNRGYAFNFDNRPETRGRGFSSSSSFNNAPSNERNRITREFRKETNISTRPSGTTRNRQEVIPIRENDNQQMARESAPATRQSNTQDNRMSPNRTQGSNRMQQDNGRQNNDNYNYSPRNNENRSSSYESERGREGGNYHTHGRNSDSNSRDYRGDRR